MATIDSILFLDKCIGFLILAIFRPHKGASYECNASARLVEGCEHSFGTGKYWATALGIFWRSII